MTRSVVALTCASAPRTVLIGGIVGALSVTDVVQVQAAFVLLTAAMLLLAWVGHVGMTRHVRHSGPLYAQVAQGLGAVPALRRWPSSASLALCRHLVDDLRIPAIIRISAAAIDDHNRVSACLPTTPVRRSRPTAGPAHQRRAAHPRRQPPVAADPAPDGTAIVSVSYRITPFEPPPWSFEANDFLDRIKQRWPTARTWIDPDRPMPIEALILFDPPRRNLSIALSGEGWFVSLDQADPQAVAEFSAWYATQLPGTDPPVFLSTDDVLNLRLGPHTTEEAVLRFLADPRRHGTTL